MIGGSMWKSLFILIIFSCAVFGASCELRYQETLHIKVMDGSYRPIVGAAVNVTYQKDFTTGKGFVTTNTQYTNADGIVDVPIMNIEQNPSHLDCSITITAQYDGRIVQRTDIEAQRHDAEIQVLFNEVHILSISAVDKLGAPIPDAPIRINSMYRNTSSNGEVSIPVNAGIVDVALTYRDGVISQRIEVKDEDLSYTLQARVYSLHLNVIDDAGNPLEADITVERNTTHASSVEIPSIALVNPYVKVSYGSVEKVVPADLSKSADYTVIFDKTPPQIKGVRVEQKANEDIKVYFSVVDPNQYASGPAPEEITVTYSIGGTSQQAVPYLKSGVFVAEIPAPPKNSLVRFTITAYDKEGNMDTVNGEYLVPGEGQGQQNGTVIQNGTVSGNGTVNGTGNATGTETGEQPISVYGIWPFVLGGVVLLIIAYAVFHYVKGVSEG